MPTTVTPTYPPTTTITGTLVFRETSQQCNVNNQQSCYDCRSEPGRCCNLDLPNNPDNTTYPLGYQSFSIPGADSSDPDPCVRISVSGTINNTAIFYLIMAVSETMMLKEMVMVVVVVGE